MKRKDDFLAFSSVPLTMKGSLLNYRLTFKKEKKYKIYPRKQPGSKTA